MSKITDQVDDPEGELEPRRPAVVAMVSSMRAATEVGAAVLGAGESARAAVEASLRVVCADGAERATLLSWTRTDGAQAQSGEAALVEAAYQGHAVYLAGAASAARTLALGLALADELPLCEQPEASRARALEACLGAAGSDLEAAPDMAWGDRLDLAHIDRLLERVMARLGGGPEVSAETPPGGGPEVSAETPPGGAGGSRPLMAFDREAGACMAGLGELALPLALVIRANRPYALLAGAVPSLFALAATLVEHIDGDATLSGELGGAHLLVVSDDGAAQAKGAATDTVRIFTVEVPA